MTEEQQKDFKEEMRQDALEEKHEEQRILRHMYMMRTDYDYFRKDTEEVHIAALDALQALKQIYEMCEQEWDIKELGDELN